MDGQTIEQFEADLGEPLQDLEPDELGQLLSTAGACCHHSEKEWRRADLGVPTVGDRIAQMVVKRTESRTSILFSGQTLTATDRENRLGCGWGDATAVLEIDWVLEFDIEGLFDNLPHDLLLRAVQKHVKCKWALLYIERWLTAPMEKEGLLIERTRGTPQGGVISPILSNLSCTMLLTSG